MMRNRRRPMLTMLAPRIRVEGSPPSSRDLRCHLSQYTPCARPPRSRADPSWTVGDLGQEVHQREVLDREAGHLGLAALEPGEPPRPEEALRPGRLAVERGALAVEQDGGHG